MHTDEADEDLWLVESRYQCKLNNFKQLRRRKKVEQKLQKVVDYLV